MLCICHHYFVFNATATTEIYTDWHTLSLHDALPISRGADLDDVGAPFDLVAHRLAALIGPRADALARGERRDALGGKRRPVATAAGCGNRIRSEEHTSELQSLMRISYAVFCLQKKKPHTNTTTKDCATEAYI